MKSKIVHHLPSSDAACNPRNSEGAFIRLKDNRIAYYYTRYHGNSFDDNATADIAVCYSSDLGESWTESEIVIKGPEDGNVMSVSLLRLQDGRIMMVYLKKQILPDMVLCRQFCHFSEDEGKTWTDADCIIKTPGYFVGNNDRLVQLRSGRILYPVAFTNYVNFGGVCFIYYSDDNGKTWQPSSWILPPADKQNDGRCGLQEPGVVELPEDNKLMCWQRTSWYYQYQCFSNDGALTWTPAEPAFDFPSYLQPQQIKQSPFNSEYAAVWNDISERWGTPEGGVNFTSARNRFAIAFSKDCVRWERHECFEYDADAGFCYPAIEFLPDGSILLAYCCGGHGKCCLQDLCIRKFYI